MRAAFLVISLCLGVMPALATPSAQEELCAAAKSGTPADISAALAKGANVNGRCNTGGSDAPLGNAMTVAKVDNMEALIKAGANVVGSKKRVPIAYSRNEASAALLIEHGAKVNMVDDLGNTPLMNLPNNVASNFDDFYKMADEDAAAIAKLLIAHGANVKFADKHGNTALMGAAFGCLPKLSAALIDAGADVNATVFGQTPLARLSNIQDMNPSPCGETAGVLLAHGATK